MRLSALAPSVFVLGLASAASAQQAPSTSAVWQMPTTTAPAPTSSVVAPSPAAPGYVAGPAYVYPRPTMPPQAAASPPVEQEQTAPLAPKSKPISLDVGVTTDVPLYVGGTAVLELHRFLFGVGLGVMPRPYAEGIDSALVAFGAYDNNVSRLVRDSMQSAFVMRASLGLRPFSDHGFEIYGGYTLINASGAVTGTDVVNAVLAGQASSVTLPAELGAEVPVFATLHNLHVTLGWRWLAAADRLVIRAQLGYTQTLDSKMGVNIPDNLGAITAAEPLANQVINDFMKPYFSKYGKLPSLGLSAAFRF